MGSVVPGSSSDQFTSELRMFLTSLADTSGTEFDNLTNQLVRLREVLLNDIQENDTIETNDTETEASASDKQNVSTETEASNESDQLNGTTATKDAGTDEETVSKTSSSNGKGTDRGHSKATVKIKTPQKGSLISNHRVMISLQKGARYELEEKLVKEALSQFGKVVNIKLYMEPNMGSFGYVEFRTVHSAGQALNQVVRAGCCLLHTDLPLSLLTQVPIPHQVLLESRYLPQVWEKEIVLRTYFSKFGEVTGVTRLGFQRFIVSFKEASVAQELIGTNVKIFTCTVLVKEVSNNTVWVRKNTCNEKHHLNVGGEGM